MIKKPIKTFLHASNTSVCYSSLMPRGKRTVFMMLCSACGQRTGTVRLHKQNSKGVGWKDFKKTNKYCGECRKKVNVKLKEERHSD